MWQTVPAVRGFVQREPREGAEPAQATEFRVAYDATTLYVQVRAFDTEPDKIVTYLTRRDDESPCDWIASSSTRTTIAARRTSSP